MFTAHFVIVSGLPRLAIIGLSADVAQPLLHAAQIFPGESIGTKKEFSLCNVLIILASMRNHEMSKP